jgi:hypothetical protein
MECRGFAGALADGNASVVRARDTGRSECYLGGTMVKVRRIILEKPW